MKDLLEYIVKNLVSNPDGVEVNEESQDGNVNLYLKVDPADMGIVIGKGGQTIHALRKILTVRAIAENVRVNLQLVEPEGGAPKKESNESDLPAGEAASQSEKAAQEAEDSPKETPEEGEAEDK